MRTRLFYKKCENFPYALFYYFDLFHVPRSFKCPFSKCSCCGNDLFLSRGTFKDIRNRAIVLYSTCINNCPTRCNTKQSIYYSASSLYIFRVSTTPIIRSTQNCKYSLRCWCSYLPPTWPSLATLEGGSCTKNMTSTRGCSYSFVYS